MKGKYYDLIIDRRTGEQIGLREIEPKPDDMTWEEWRAKILHDCPECRAALERGERPTYGTLPALPRRSRWARAERWRKRKQRR